MTTDRKNFIFTVLRGIMEKSKYPGIAKLVSRLVWDQETVRSSRTTRTKIPLKSTISEGFSYSLFIAAQKVKRESSMCVRLKILPKYVIILEMSKTRPK